MTTVIDGTSGTSIAGASSTQGAFTLGGQLNLIAGTTSIAPIDFAAGTNLTTPAAGVMEYDGKVFYGTPIGTQRGVMMTPQFFRLDAGLAGANVTTAQNVFGVGVTLSSGTVYAFESVFALAKTAGVTSHFISVGFGGTATINNTSYLIQNLAGTSSTANALNLSSGSPGASNTSYNTSVTPVQTTSATTTAAVAYGYIVRGTVSVANGGTFIPQYTLSAAPGGAYTTQPGSYFLIYPIGASGANTSVGTWA